MKSCVIGIALVLLLTPAFYAQQSVPEIPFDSVPNFLKLPAELHLGEASGVAVNSKGHVFVFSRGNTTGPAYAATASQIVEFGADGKYIREIGHNLYAWSFAHTVRVDKDDNIWAVDKGVRYDRQVQSASSDSPGRRRRVVHDRLSTSVGSPSSRLSTMAFLPAPPGPDTTTENSTIRMDNGSIHVARLLFWS